MKETRFINWNMYTGCLKKNFTYGIFPISEQPNGFTYRFFLLKTYVHTQILNTESFLRDFRGLRYSRIKMCFWRRQVRDPGKCRSIPANASKVNSGAVRVTAEQFKFKFFYIRTTLCFIYISHPGYRCEIGLYFLINCDNNNDFVKLQSSLTVQYKSVGLGVDFVFPPSQQQQLTSNPHQNLPEGIVVQIWNLALRLNS